MPALGQFDYLVNNQQYTFSFGLGNWFSLPDTNVLQGELTSLEFLNQISVSSAGIVSWTYNVTFVFIGQSQTYTVDDVQSEIVATWGIGGDNFSYQSATGGVQSATQTIASQAVSTATTAGATVGGAVGGAASSALKNPAFDVTLGVIVLVVLGYFLLASGAGAALARR